MTANAATSIAKTVFRVAVGSVLVAHGAQKLLGWFGGAGLTRTGQAMHAMGFRPGKPHAFLAGLTETGGGAALVMGLATPAAGSALAIAMGTAAGALKDNGFFAAKNGLEYPALLGLAAATFALDGAGPVSLDAATGQILDRAWMRILGLAVLPLVLAFQLARRHRVLENDQPLGLAADESEHRAV